MNGKGAENGASVQVPVTPGEPRDIPVVVTNDPTDNRTYTLSLVWPIGLQKISGVIAPVRGEAPVTNIIETDQYTGTVKWSPTPIGGVFAPDTAYRATITLSAKSGYTLRGVRENFFTVDRATTVSNAQGSGVVTAVFEKTEPTPTYTMTADKTGLDFGQAPVEYAAAPDAQTVEITNTGNQTVTLIQPAATGTNYAVGELSKMELEPKETATFTVQPITGLAKATYNDNVTVTNTQGVSVSISLTFTVTDKPTYTLTVSGGTGGGNYEKGAAVTITATVPSGQRFTGWTGLDGLTITQGTTTTETVTFTMPDQPVNVTAHFENIPTGGGSSTPSATDKAVDAIEKAQPGETVKVELPSNGKVPGKVLEEAAGKDVTVEISAGSGVTWIVNGLDIPSGTLADLNLKVDTKANTIPVTVINEVTGEQKVMQLALSHNGDFPVPLTLRLDTGKDNAGLFANLYYYNETTKELEYQTTAEIGPDGSADIPFAHASSYAVVIDSESHAPNPFTDVQEGDWYYDAVAYVNQKGLMTGMSETLFDPDGAVTRAQVWTVLARMDGQEISGGDPWYAPAQTWAVTNGVSDGTDPDGAVTREQLVTMLWRYAQNAGMDVSVWENTNILSYDDASDVTDWAVSAFQWACGAGVVSGTSDTTLSPQAGATRAQLAVILQCFSSGTV